MLTRLAIIGAGAVQLARLDAGNRLFQHLLIKFVAYLIDMARLFFAKDIARAAQVEIL